MFNKFKRKTKLKVENISLVVDQFVKRFWYFLCAVPLLFQTIFHIIKNGKLELEHVWWDALPILILTFLGMLIVVWRHKYITRCLPWIVATTTILVSISVALQSDRDLSWPGNDVAIENYRAALIAKDEGILELIDTWNARANPYTESTIIDNPQEILTRINKYGLGFLLGSRWDRRDLPQDNGRMMMHPPGNPVVLCLWLKLFGQSHLAATAYVLFVRYCLIIGTIYWALRYIPSVETLNRIAIAFLLATAPRMLSVIIPHPNELATLLALGAVVMATSEMIRRRFIAYLLSGMLLAGAAYVNFCFVIVGLIVTGILILSKEAWRKKLPVAFLIGEGIVVIFFMILGYYPWLTFLTGNQITYYNQSVMSKFFLHGLAGFIAISIPLLLITFLSLGRLDKMRGSITQIWMVACISALFVYSYIIFPYPPSRYLIGMFFLLIPLLSLTIRELQLSVYQVMMIPVTNFIYMAQGLFF